LEKPEEKESKRDVKKEKTQATTFPTDQIVQLSSETKTILKDQKGLILIYFDDLLTGDMEQAVRKYKNDKTIRFVKATTGALAKSLLPAFTVKEPTKQFVVFNPTKSKYVLQTLKDGSTLEGIISSIDTVLGGSVIYSKLTTPIAL